MYAHDCYESGFTDFVIFVYNIYMYINIIYISNMYNSS